MAFMCCPSRRCTNYSRRYFHLASQARAVGEENNGQAASQPISVSSHPQCRVLENTNFVQHEFRVN